MAKINKTEVILISGIIIVFFVFIAIFIFSLMSSHSQTPNLNNVVTPTIVPLNNASPATAPIKLNEASVWKLAEMLMHPPLLNPNDESAKNAILVPLNGSAGNVYTTENVTVFYLPSIKEFQGEIESMNIDIAKKETVDWFRSKGMSQQGICNLPLEFFLNIDVADNPKLKNITFDPLPPGC